MRTIHTNILQTLLCLSLLLVGFTATGQVKHRIILLANGQTDSIVLRWAPTTPLAWEQGNVGGYIVERFTISRNGELLTQPEPEKRLLSPQPIKPLPDNQWTGVVANNEYAEAVQGLIYEATEAPTDDSWASIMERRDELEQRYGFALFLCDIYPEIADAAALRWVDRDVKPGEQYAYRIRLADVLEGMDFEPTTVVLTATDAFKTPLITRIQARFLDHKVDLSWPIHDHKGFYTGYYIERSTDSINFVSLTEMPVPPMSEDEDPVETYYTDSIPENGVTYYYRIRGFTPFATVSEPSPVVSGEGQRLFEARPVVDTAYVMADNSVKVRWALDPMYHPVVKEVAVYCSQYHDGPYERVNKQALPVTATEIIDEPRQWLNSYYRVHAYGNQPDLVAVSFPYFVQREDSIPPAPPVGLKGKADTTGIVYLQWMPNTEDDMYGYRVFRGNSPNEEFAEVTAAPLADAHFRDSINLNTITSNVYYKVIALDKRYNASDYSEMLTIRRPDTIPPVPPVIVRSGIDKHVVFLELEYGNSSDVAYYELHREIENQNSELVRTWPHTNNMESRIVDSLAEQGYRYRYIVTAVDSSDNRSRVTSKYIHYETGLRPAITDVKLKVDREEKKVIIEWNYPLAAEVERYFIYRAKEDEQLILYKTVDGSQNKWEDTELNPNNRYRYKLRALFKNGANSVMSKEWEVRY